MTPKFYERWLTHLRSDGARMSSVQSEACARLAAVLLCGEQSAIQIFAAERGRGRAATAALDALLRIEFDEHLHEKSLVALCEYLPCPDDAHRLKRRAQHFFARIGRESDMAAHFGTIAELDSAVCKIMWHIENSSIDRHSPLRLIATQIKNDEARHVTVSRRYSSALGTTLPDRKDNDVVITERLIKMLDPLTSSFEVIGVDSDRLFQKIRGDRLL